MPETPYILAAILISSGITWALRALPFAFLGPMRRSALLPYLNDYMPPGVIAILVLYTVRETPIALTSTTVAVTAGLIATTGLHLWRRNATLSVLGGTAVHVLIASLLPH
ncbi:AzlD domain-containing protein [Zhihengliuella sp.]|uniref:branched-chain amino acid transporter permease n=1 Tax=Zhihengliuella sp. TaxID=1954483 RepID=UPI0028119B49|nr:AzlD domain-containing protein [Zhihengliuella sp.]